MFFNNYIVKKQSIKRAIPKLKKSEINNLLRWNDNEFTVEHQLLNGSIIYIGLIYLITVILKKFTIKTVVKKKLYYE